MEKKTEAIIYRILHILERFIAFLTLAVLLVILGLEIYRMFTLEGYFSSVDLYLQNILTVVVGLEFVRMLLDFSPASILEVLIAAIAKHIILIHEPWSLIANVVCIGVLFAVRHFWLSEGPRERRKNQPKDTP